MEAQQDKWMTVAQQQTGTVRVERRFLSNEEYRLVSGPETWPLDSIEGNYWYSAYKRLPLEEVDYHLGNLALAHSMCIKPGTSFADREEQD